MYSHLFTQDPSVQQAAGNNVARAQQGLEEYNPFDGNQVPKSTQVNTKRETLHFRRK